MEKKFTGIMPAIVTPFCEDNKTINIESVEKLVDLFLEQGANGFYVLGGTGEGAILDREQRETMCEAVVKYTAKRKPVINHVCAFNVREAIELAKHAERVGADAIASIPPLLYGYGDDGIYEYYKALANSVGLPVMVYYQPSAGRDMSAELIARIFEIDNVTGVKWSSYNYFELMKLKDMTHGEMNIINGPDELLISGLMAGADGGIGTTYNMMLPEFVKIYDYFTAGKIELARETQFKVNRVIDMLLKYSRSNNFDLLCAVKYAMGCLGIDVGGPTYPMKTIGAEEGKQLEMKLKEFGWPLNF